MKYDFAAIEKKWQKRWEETKPLSHKHISEPTRPY